jgi:voltage-gated potassium channel Kch
MIALLLRRTLVTVDFVSAAGLRAVSLPNAEEGTQSIFESLMACLQSLDCGPHHEHSLFEFEADYFVHGDATGEAVLAQTCAVIRRHRHTLRRLKVPTLQQQDGARALASALAECTAVTSLDFSFNTFPFRSWQQLGPTLHTLVLGKIDGDGTDTTFRLLADNMPALRDLEFFILDQPSQDGFIELVSRLRSLSLRACSRPWDSVHHTDVWPLTLPNLEELLWWADGGVDAVAVAVLRRAVSLRAADVSHASALAAIAAAAGPVTGLGSNGDPHIFAPLSNVHRLALTAIVDDPAGLVTTLAAPSRVSAVRLRWSGYTSELWDFLRAVASVSPPGDAAAEARRRVRRVYFEVGHAMAAPDPEVAARCVRALFPRVRYTWWGAFGSPHMALFCRPSCRDEVLLA